MVLERISSGVANFDPLIGGGFPRGSAIIVCGSPGTGKTVFSAQFIYKGIVDYDEKGVYISFGESRKIFYEYMKMLGFDFEKLESDGKFAFMEMLTGKKEVYPESLKMIVEKVYELDAKRLVIDPITAMSQAFDKSIDVRTLLHTVLGKIIRQAECTTLMVVEAPLGKGTVGLGIEEFVADGVLLLKRKFYDKRLVREIEILKLRGTRVTHPTLTFTLDQGFHVFPPVELDVSKEYGKYETVPHEKDSFSTGIRDLDKMIGKAFVKGGFELVEIEKDVAFPVERFIAPTICNFLNQDYGVAIIPPQGISAKTLKTLVEPHVNNATLQKILKIADFRIAGEAIAMPSYVLPLRGQFIVEDMKRFWDAVTDLREKTGKPVFSVVGYDTLEYIYGAEETLKTLGEDMARIKNFEDLRVNIVRPTVKIADQLRALAHLHIKISQINGAIFIYGVKPKTQLQNMQITVEGNIRKIKLKPIL